MCSIRCARVKRSDARACAVLSLDLLLLSPSLRPSFRRKRRTSRLTASRPTNSSMPPITAGIRIL